jgi:hypothetical protein
MKPTNKKRLLRRFRAEFRKDLGIGHPNRADRTLIEQAALVALRTREMREAVIAGQPIDDEDFVRLVRATTAVIKTFKDHGNAKKRNAPPISHAERLRLDALKPRRKFDANDL